MTAVGAARLGVSARGVSKVTAGGGAANRSARMKERHAAGCGAAGFGGMWPVRRTRPANGAHSQPGGGPLRHGDIHYCVTAGGRRRCLRRHLETPAETIPTGTDCQRTAETVPWSSADNWHRQRQSRNRQLPGGRQKQYWNRQSHKTSLVRQSRPEEQ
ncbi:hypothetical protein FJT64_016805 [Amphibalanus amphitrite]|uniref:Uncharacterized protein n=1 Tax=Amphibalanus amphitrite TaxID=1232801 RepID=A0A6A4X4N4_AMPAM|nr:hypothetical protein FJT64_016805 [Amphibalanus amphitrite]